METADDLTFDERDSAAFMPRCRVIDPAFTWGDDRPPRTPWERTVIYEAHVRGYTKLHPDVRPELCGTFRGLVEPQVLEHLRSLGVTAIELLPIHTFVNDNYLLEKGAHQLLGLQHHIVFLAHAELLLRSGLRVLRVQGDGRAVSRRRNRGDPGRCLQSHG